MDKLNLMTSFIAVAEEGTYTAAGKRLGKTTPLISTHVSQLEDLLGARLITRSTRSLKLTPTGQSYYEEAKKVLDDIATLEAQVRQETQSLVGQLRISAPVTFGEQVLMPFVAKMVEDNPRLNVELMLNDRYIDIVAEGFDIAVRIGTLEDSTLIAKRIGHVRMLLCASPGFIERYGNPESPTELKALPCVFDSNFRQIDRWRFRHNGKAIEVTPNVIARVNSPIAAAQLAKTGQAVTYAPEFSVSDELKNGSLVEILSDYSHSDLPLSMIYPHRKHLSAKVSIFVEKFAEYLSR